MPAEPKCCGCCCPIVQGLKAYSAVFLVLGVLSIYHYTPSPSASMGLTFIMSDVVDDADAFCSSWEACPEICGKDDSMSHMAQPRTAGQVVAFVGQLAYIAGLAACLAGASLRNLKLLKGFIAGVPIVLLIFLIGYALISSAAPEPVRAWYLYNKDDFDDHDAECSAKWVDDADRSSRFSLALLWVGWILTAALLGHIGFTAWGAHTFISKTHPEEGGAGVIGGVQMPEAMPTATATAVAVPVPTATAVAVRPGIPAPAAGAVAVAAATAPPTAMATTTGTVVSGPQASAAATAVAVPVVPA